MNRTLTIHAVLKARRKIFVVKFSHETHKQKDFSFAFFYLFKRLIFTKYSLATSSAGLPFAPTSKFI